MTRLKRALVPAAVLVLPLLAGVAPSPTGKQYQVCCRLTKLDGTEVGSPKVTVVAGQAGSFTAGGEAITPRSGVTLAYGTALTAWVRPTTAGELLLDVTVTWTDVDLPDAGSVAVGGYTVRTVRTVSAGQPFHVPVGPAHGITCDLTVYDVSK